MDTTEIVRRLLSRPVTGDRPIKVLHLLNRPEQLQDVLAELNEKDRAVMEQILTPSVVQGHFARRGR